MIPFKVNQINEIRRLLRDRYKEGFPIIKEIVQNADDSGATRLDFGWTSGLPTANHVLLQRPTLFFLNNGEFTKSNEQSIISFGMDDRAGQKATIGKFGLGQKSVFHLCDAFFFLGASESEHFETANLLDPWADRQGNDSNHPDWKPFAKADETLIKEYLNKKITLPPSYFILWIPLRQKTDQSIIVKEFPGDKSPQELFINDLANDIGVLLPLLRSLTEIHYWLPNRQKNLKRQFHILLKGSRRIYPSNAETDPIGDFQFNGNILEKITGSKIQFTGQESLLDIGEHEKKLKPFFPQHETENGETVPDKSIPHCAVTLIQKPAKQAGTLSIQWAVFLPVGDPEKPPNEQISHNGSSDFTLLLHGYFFLDSGRSRIEAWESADLKKPPTQETEAVQQWNQLLATKGTLKNVLPTVNLFVEKYKPNSEEIWQLSNALKNSNLFRQYGKNICQDFQWVYVADKQKWQCIDSKKPLLAIPRTGTDKTSLLPWEVLPNLQSIQECFITLIEAPNLTTSLSDWTETQLETVLQDVPSFLVFQDQKQLEYLLSFLEQCVVPLFQNQILPESLQNRLCDIARKAIARLKWNHLHKLKELVTTFLNFIPEKCFFIKCETGYVNILSELHKLDTHTILIPQTPTFDFSEVKINTKQKLANQKAVTLLERLNSMILSEKKQDSRESCAAIAWKILCLAADKKALVETHPDLRVLRAHNCRVHQDRTIVSLKEITSAYQDGTLFHYKRGSSTQERIGFADHLQNVLTKATVIVFEKPVETEVADLLGNIKQNEIIACEQLGCLRVLSRIPPLTLNPHIEHRAKLLKLLLDANVADGIFTKGIRYLLTLHVESDLEDKHPLWYLSSSQYTDFVEKILTARGKKAYLINDAFVPSVTNKLANEKRVVCGIEELTPIKAIELALSYDKPHALCQTILDALQYVDIDSLSSEEQQHTAKDLRQKLWLVDKNGTAIKPEDVIYLPEIKETVSRIIGEQTTYLDYLRLAQEIQNHASFQKLCELPIFAVGSGGLEILGLMMLGEEKYHLGKFSKEYPFPFQEGLTVFKDVKPDILPAWAIIRIANESYPDQVQSLLSGLFAQMPTPRLVNLLIWLKEQHIQNPITTTKELILKVFNSYLAMAVANDENFNDNDIFRQIPLLSRSAQWKSASELSLGAQNIEDDHLLDHTQGNILQSRTKSLSNKSTANSLTAEVDNEQNIIDFEQYFAKWRDQINHELIGIFLAVLGDVVLSRESQFEDSINTSFASQLAQRYLGEYRTIEEVRKGLKIDNIDNFVVKVNATQHQSGKVELIALDGARFEASLCDTAKSVFIDHNIQEFSETSKTLIVKISDVKHRINTSNRQKLMTIGLLDIDTERQYDSNRLSNLLREATGSVLRCIYNQSNTDALEQLWDKFSQTEQLDIETTRQWILKSAFFYLPQLNDYRTGGNDFRQLLKERERLDFSQDSLVVEEYYQKEQSLITKLGELIETKSEEQTSILEAIKTTISSNYQYHPQSVPFELFQNADDAVVELEEMSCQLEQSLRLVLSWDETTLTVMHWGRAINWFHYGNYSADEGKKRGFDTDLKKMLVLNSSDKGEKVTGKFGLGFKSVFLICQQPRILSGHPTISCKQLGFQIIAGMLPVPLADENRTKLVTTLQNQTPDNSPVGTIIELALDKGYTPNDIVDSFKTVVGVLLTFSKRIKRCDFNSPTGNHSVIWQPTEILEGIFIGYLKLKTEQDEPSTVLLIQNPEKEGIIMLLGSQGVEKLPEHIPDIWVTTPLKESMGFPFAINGRFEIDIGRAQLAPHSNNNVEITKNLCRFVGQKLGDLFEKHQEPAFKFNEKLGLATDLSDYDFWYSMWEILGDSWIKNHPSIKLKLGDFILVKQLLNKRPAFPTGLWGEYRVLTDFNKIESVTMGLMQEHAYFEQVAAWKQFQTQFLPGTIASNEQWSRLQKLLPEIPEQVEGKTSEKPNHFYLADAVELEFGQRKQVSPELAKQLGKLISREFLNELAKEKSKDKEHDNLLKVLTQAFFQAKNGQYYPVSQLLCQVEQTSDDQEECYRAALAPPEKVLASGYRDEAVSFFKACRRRMEAPIKDLCQWALRRPSNDEQKQAILYYLLKGEKNGDIARTLGTQEVGWWRSIKQDDELFKDSRFDGWKEDEKREVVFKLDFAQWRNRWQEEDLKERETRDLEETNRKIGENVERVIQKIIHNKGLNVINIHKGGDLKFWPEEEKGCDCFQMKISSNLVYTMEVKFTIGSKVHLTRHQSETAREQKSQYIVLVVNGDWGLREQLNVALDEDSISKDLIIDNSYVVKKLSEKLGELPNPNEIEPDIHGYWLKKALWGNQENIVTWLDNEF
jgi:hypothetical protein